MTADTPVCMYVCMYVYILYVSRFNDGKRAYNAHTYDGSAAHAGGVLAGSGVSQVPRGAYFLFHRKTTTTIVTMVVTGDTFVIPLNA